MEFLFAAMTHVPSGRTFFLPHGVAESAASGGTGGQPMPGGITCQNCLMTSWNQHDVEHGYCGNCHDYTSRCVVSAVCDGLGVLRRSPRER